MKDIDIKSIDAKLNELAGNAEKLDNTQKPMKMALRRKHDLTKREDRVTVDQFKERVKLVRSKQRTPLSEQKRLMSFDKEDGFTYRLVNDTFDRIPKFECAGWTIVDKDGSEINPDARIQDSTWKQRARSQPVGAGKIGYMMRIPTKWYDEDIARQQRLIDERESSFKSMKRIRDEKNASCEAYGEIKIDHSLNDK